jgi:1,4-alpha-glucan branching enzyme
MPPRSATITGALAKRRPTPYKDAPIGHYLTIDDRVGLSKTGICTRAMADRFGGEGSVYQIYVRSFLDRGDGSDLFGVIAKLDYLRDLGVRTLWLTPFSGNPQRDRLRHQRPRGGRVWDAAEVRRLIDEAHRRGLQVVLDMVLNHTSDRRWFQRSRRRQD